MDSSTNRAENVWVRTNLQLITTMVELLTMGELPAEVRNRLSHLSTHIRGITMIHDLLTEDGRGGMIARISR